VAGASDLDPASNRAVSEYLAVLDDAAFGGAAIARLAGALGARTGIKAVARSIRASVPIRSG
jgi:hypothetical protein